MHRSSRHAALIALLASAVPLHAQTSQGNSALPQTIPGLDNFSIAPRDRLGTQPQITPTPTPTPVPTPSPSPATPPIRPVTIQPLPTPTPAPRPVRQAPVTATPTPRPTVRQSPKPTPTPMPSSAASPAAQPSNTVVAPETAPSPMATTTPAAAATAAPVTVRRSRPSLIWVFVLIALLILPGAVIAAWFYRRALAERAAGADVAAPEALGEVPVAPPPLPVPAPPVARRTPGSTVRPRLEIAFRPRRAGTNLTSAAVDYELVVRNVGPLTAHGVRLGVGLVTASNDHDAQLRAFFEQAVERPVIPPFDLDAGGERAIKAMVMLPKDAIIVVTVKGRPMFVPMVAINVLYDWEGGSGQTATSHIVGIERAAGERMRPFWLDVTPRMHDVVSGRPHAVTVQR